MLTVMVAMETLWTLLPGHFEIRAAGRDDAHLRIGVARPLLGAEDFGDGIVQGGLAAGHADRAAESRLHGALVLIHGVHAHQENSQEEPG